MKRCACCNLILPDKPGITITIKNEGVKVNICSLNCLRKYAIMDTKLLVV